MGYYNGSTENNNQITLATQIVTKTEQYVSVFDKLKVEPTKYELFLRSIGLKGLADRRRINRMRRRAKMMNQMEYEARGLLGDAIGMAKNVADIARRLSYQALGALHSEKPRLDVLRLELDYLLESCGESIAFVHRYSPMSFPPHHIDWTQINLNTISELGALDLEERTRIQEEWRLYMDRLQEYHQLTESIQYNDTLWKWANYLLDLSKHFSGAYDIELSRVSDRFTLYRMLLDLQDLNALDNFNQQENELVYPLADVVQDIRKVKSKLTYFTRQFPKGKG